MELIGTVARRARNVAVPYVASTSSPFSNLFGRGSQAAHLETYGSVGTLFAVVSAITTATAKQNWWLERKTQDRRVYGPERSNTRQLLQHPAIDLWDQPNAFMSRHDLVETATQHLMLTGETDWVIVKAPRFNLPIELWPVRPDRMSPNPHPEKFIDGWTYTAPGGEKIRLENDEVIQVKLPNPLDPYRGMGPVQALLADLDSVRYSAEWNRRFFLNDATPGGVIEVDGVLPDDQFRKLKERWYDQHKGVRNAHRVAFLERAHWVSQQFTMRDMQFVELRGVSRDAIREAFRVHKALLGQSDDVNRANAVAASDQLAEWVIDPTLSRYQGALNTRLLPLYGEVNTQFCYENPVQGDQAEADASLASRTASFATLVDKGVEPVDAAEVCGLPPMRLAAQPAVPALEAVPA